MSFQIKKASRSQVKLKLGLSSVSGGGKTMSALLLAKGLVGDMSKVCLIDTENSSGSLYSHLGNFDIIDFKPPYSPQRYVQAIQEVVKSGQYECLIIDSTSHEWDGSGGCLEIQENLGGRFQDWARVTPMHREFIDAILQAPIHVITTVRRKQDYSLEKGENGKTTPKKVGMKEVQREGFEYELTVNFDIEINHKALASKDRTGLFSTKVPFIINEETGKMIDAWNKSGGIPTPPKVDMPKKPTEPVNDNSSHLDNPGSYVVNFGVAHKGSSLEKMGIEDVIKYRKSLDNHYRKIKEEISGAPLEFMRASEAYLNLEKLKGNMTEPPKLDNNETIPY